ncbi:hypothetical protein ABK040_014774 [Willaertia magna]
MNTKRKKIVRSFPHSSSSPTVQASNSTDNNVTNNNSHNMNHSLVSSNNTTPHVEISETIIHQQVVTTIIQEDNSSSSLIPSENLINDSSRMIIEEDEENLPTKLNREWLSNWSTHKREIEKYLQGILINKEFNNLTIRQQLTNFFFQVLLPIHFTSLSQEKQEFYEMFSRLLKNYEKKELLIYSFLFSFNLQWGRIINNFGSNNEEIKNQYKEVMMLLVENNLIAEDDLKQTFNFEYLNDFGIDGNKERQLFRKIKTKELYTQVRYNLLHEECEGFSKLITILFDNDYVKNTPFEVLTNQIIELIGFFDLEPHRVLDIILDAYEKTLSEILLQIITKLYNTSNLRHVIGFKLLGYQKEESTPMSLFVMIIHFMRKKLLTLEEISSYLGPNTFEDLYNLHIEHESEKKKEAREYSLVSLDPNERSDKPEPRLDKSVPKFQTDQRFLFTIALLESNEYTWALQMLNHLSKYDVHWSFDITSALRKSISDLIEPISARDGALTPEDITLMETTVIPLIIHTFYELYHDITLLSKIITTLGRYAETTNQFISPQKFVTDTLVCIMSAICFISASDTDLGLVVTFWNIMSKFSYSTRYQVYDCVKKAGYDRQPKMIAQAHFAEKQIRVFFNRISSENVKKKTKEMLQFAVPNPIITCSEVLRKCENYANQITLAIDVSVQAPLLYRDVMCYCLVERLLDTQRSRIKDDGINIASWLSNLAVFCGVFFKEYPTVDMDPIFNYLIQRIKEGIWEDLIIITEIVKKASGVEYFEEIGDNQLEAHAGGKYLISEASGFAPSFTTITSKLQEATDSLRNILIKNNRGRSFLLLMAKLSNTGIFLHEEVGEHWKHITDAKDTTHVAFLVLHKFLVRETNFILEETSQPKERALLIPSITNLKLFNLTPSFIFSLVRQCISQKDSTTILSGVEELIPSNVWTQFTPQFYQFFWINDLYDIFVPNAIYTSECERIKRLLSTDDRIKQHKRRKLQYEDLLNALQDEQSRQNRDTTNVIKVFKEVHERFICSSDEFIDMSTFLQYCIIPRCLFSILDSLYCAKFIEFLHFHRTPKFSLLYFMQVLFEFIPGLILSSTENEVKRLSRMTLYLLNIVNKWRDNQEDFNSFCKNRCSKVANIDLLTQSEDRFISLDYETFQQFYFIILDKLLNELAILLKTNDDMKLRLILIFLTPLAKARAFPYYKRHTEILSDISQTLDNHPVENIESLGRAYHPIIKDILKKSKNDPSFIKELEEKKKKKLIVEEPIPVATPVIETTETIVETVATAPTMVSDASKVVEEQPQEQQPMEIESTEIVPPPPKSDELNIAPTSTIVTEEQQASMVLPESNETVNEEKDKMVDEAIATTVDTTIISTPITPSLTEEEIVNLPIATTPTRPTTETKESERTVETTILPIVATTIEEVPPPPPKSSTQSPTTVTSSNEIVPPPPSTKPSSETTVSDKKELDLRLKNKLDQQRQKETEQKQLEVKERLQKYMGDIDKKLVVPPNYPQSFISNLEEYNKPPPPPKIPPPQQQPPQDSRRLSTPPSVERRSTSPMTSSSSSRKYQSNDNYDRRLPRDSGYRKDYTPPRRDYSRRDTNSRDTAPPPPSNPPMYYDNNDRNDRNKGGYRSSNDHKRQSPSSSHGYHDDRKRRKE